MCWLLACSLLLQRIAYLFDFGMPRTELGFDMSDEDFKMLTWRFGSTLGMGVSAVVYEYTNEEFDCHAAIKSAITDSNALEREFTAYNAIHNRDPDAEGFCQVYYRGFGTDGRLLHLVLERLGPNVDTQVREFTRLRHVSVLKIGIQLVTRIQLLHSIGIVHRDIKPENIALGYDDPETIYLIDFGACAGFREATGEHKPDRHEGYMVTTYEYASAHAHHCRSPSRRDDIESAAYSLIYMARGTLPWSCVREDPHRVEDRPENAIARIKDFYSISQLCWGLPSSLRDFLAHAKSLEYKSTPDYAHLRDLLHRDLRILSNGQDTRFEWNQDN